MNRVQRLLAATSLLVGGAVYAGAVHAADSTSPSASQVTEVIVTARKREERVQDVPAAITAFNAQTIKAASVFNLTDLDGKIPNVTLEAVATFPNASSFSIRGLGFGDVESTFEPTVGVDGWHTPSHGSGQRSPDAWTVVEASGIPWRKLAPGAGIGPIRCAARTS